MGLGTAFGTLLKNIGPKVATAAEEAAVKAAPAAEQAMAKAAPSMTQTLIKESLPSAAMTAGMNLIGGAGVPASLLSGAVDLGINVGGMKLAGKYAPGNLGTITYKDPGTNKLISKQQFIPSGPQAVVQAVAPVISSLAVLPLTMGQQQVQQQQVENIDQTASIDQQTLQRAYLNNMQAMPLSPGTNFQMQGLEQTYNPYLSSQLMVPQDLDPYNLSRGAM